MAMEVEIPHNEYDEALPDEVLDVEVKSLSPDPLLRRTRPRYKVICKGEMPKEINERLKKLYPYVDQKETPLPLRWSHQDKATALIITNNHRHVSYTDIGDPGREANAKDAAAVRADHPIPISCGIFYFEVNVMCSEAECCMGVGLCERNVDLNRLPGWDKFSYGYHGDDGNFFCSSGSGQAYGPTFTTGDIIGCGINFVTKSIFFTKNGENLGYAIQNVENVVELYPMIGLQKNGEITDSNFGQRPFKYNIEQELKGARDYTFEEICKVDLPQAKTGWMDRAISSWLSHEGYGRALAAFKKHADQNLDESGDVQMEREEEEANEMLQRRRELKKMILDGEVGEAISHVQAMCPDLLEQNKELMLLLKCQQYVETYAKANHINISSIPSRDCVPAPSLLQREENPAKISLSTNSGYDSYAQVYSRKGQPYVITANNDGIGTVNPFKRRSNEREPFAYGARRIRTANDEMEVDTQQVSPMQTADGSAVQNAEAADVPMEDGSNNSGRTSSSNGVVHGNHITNVASASNGSATTSNGAASETNGVSQPAITSATTIIDEDQDPSSGDTHQDVIGGAERAYTSRAGWTGGNPRDMMTREEMCFLLDFGAKLNIFCQGMANPPADLLRRMQDTLALICHTKPLETSLRYLLDSAQRVHAANGLNCALREHMGYPFESLLGLHFRTARKLRNELSKNKFGVAVFADIDKMVTQNLDF